MTPGKLYKVTCSIVYFNYEDLNNVDKTSSFIFGDVFIFLGLKEEEDAFVKYCFLSAKNGKIYHTYCGPGEVFCDFKNVLKELNI